MAPHVVNTLPKVITWPQWAGGMGATLMMSTVGLLGGWTSPYLAKLTSEESPLPITLDEASWVASLLHSGRFAGAIFGSVGVAYLGSKTALMLCGIPIGLAWIFTIVADSVTWLYVARISGGFGLGMVFCCYPLYLGEISDPKIRGALVGMALTGNYIGFAMGSTMGAFISMALFAWISLIPNVICLALFLWLPESSHHLVQRNKIEEAEKSLGWYHRDANVKSEVKSLKEFVQAESLLSMADKLKSLGTRQNRKALVTVMMLYIFMQLSGTNNIGFYMEIILNDAKVDVIAPSTIVTVISVLAIFAGWGSAYCVDQVGRRVLLISSSLSVGLGMVSLGIYFSLMDYGYDLSEFQWLPIVSLVVVYLGMCFGVLVIPSTILSELCAPNIKAIVACIVSIVSAIFAFVSSKSYQPMVDALGVQYVFWIYALLMAASMFYTLLFVPETKGKTLQEIQIMLAKK